MRKLIQFLLFLLLTSCSTYSEQEIQDFDSKISSHIKRNKLKFIKSSSGLYYHLKKMEKANLFSIQIVSQSPIQDFY